MPALPVARRQEPSIPGIKGAMPLRAIGFDIDGTLYSAPSLYLRLMLKGLTRIRLLAAFNEVRHDLRKLIGSPEYRARGIAGVAAFHRFQAELTAIKLGADPALVHDEIESFFYTESLEPFRTIKPYPGVTRVLEDLRSNGIRLGAFSDFPCERKLELLGLADCFDVALTSEETGLVKPDRAGFDLMAKKLGVASEDILYVGNSERYDVAGALGAGMRAALISRRRFAGSAAEFTFFNFDDLGRYITLHSNHQGRS